MRFGDGIPFAIEYTYVPKKYFGDIDNFDFSKVSLYDYMEAKGIAYAKYPVRNFNAPFPKDCTDAAVPGFALIVNVDFFIIPFFLYLIFY